VKKFKAVKIQSGRREVIFMAKSAKKGKKDEDELLDDELESLEDLDLEVDDTDDEAEETPKKDKKGKKNKSKGESKPSRSRTTDGKVGTREIADAAGLEGTAGARTLRMVLRKHNIPKDEETGRYEWDSLEDKTVKKILKLINDGEAEKVKKEGLDRLKEQQAAKREAKKAAKGKKGKKNKKAKDVDEDDE
jgi:hypothetical protein